MTEVTPAEPSGLDRSERALLETLVHEAPVAFAFYDRDLRYRLINRALAQTNGLSIAAHLGRRPSDILPAEMAGAIEAVLQRVVSTGAVVTDDDFTTVDASGSTQHWQSAWYPARDERGHVIGVAVLVTDVTDRRRAEQQLVLNHRRTARLQRATAALATAITVDDVVAVVRDVGHDPAGATWAGIGLLEGDEIRFRGRVVRPELHHVPVHAHTPTAAALRTGEPVYLRSRDELQARFAGPRATSYLAGTVEQAWAVLPLHGLAGPLAVLRLAYEERREFGPDERIFLEALAGQCALALERARVYERERRTAATLQASLLPARLPDVPGIEVAAKFVPAAAEDASVGGDWYDAYALPSGEVAFVIGDVMGKGVVAAAGMGRVRSALRALSLADAEPAFVLGGLDRAFAATEDDEQLTTLVYAVVDPATATLRMCSAGHPPLLLLPGDGSAPRYLDEPVVGTPLGLPEDRAATTVRLAPGDTLLGYSDGLFVGRDRDLDDALADIAAAAAGGRERPLGALVEHVTQEVTGGSAREDDVTVIAVRIPATPPG